MQDNITVNNVPLREFLNEHEPLSDEEKRSRVFKDAQEKVFKYHKSKPRFDYAEKNGRVKRLSKYEINRENFENELKKQIEAVNTTKMAIVVMMSEKDRFFTTIEVADMISFFAEQHDLEVSGKLRHAMRMVVGSLARTELGKYIVCKDRKHNHAHNRYKFTEFLIENFTFEEAFAMQRNKVVKKVYAQKEVVREEKKEENPTPIIEKPSTAISLKTLKQFPGITIQGDIHIHLHLK